MDLWVIYMGKMNERGPRTLYNTLIKRHRTSNYKVYTKSLFTVVKAIMGRTKNNRYVDIWTFGPLQLHTIDQFFLVPTIIKKKKETMQQISELRLAGSAPKKSLITIEQKF